MTNNEKRRRRRRRRRRPRFITADVYASSGFLFDNETRLLRSCTIVLCCVWVFFLLFYFEIKKNNWINKQKSKH